MGNSCILFTFFPLLFLQWKLPADGRVDEYKEVWMGNCRKALLIEILIEPFAILRVLDGISSHYLNVTSGAFYCARVHIRYLLIRFTPLYLKYKYDTPTRDWAYAIHDIFAVFPSFKASFRKIMLA